MIPVADVTAISLLYFGALFALAFYADQRRAAGKSLLANPYVYSLSLGVFLTSWTFYGNVGRAATVGLDFFAIFFGATLMASSWWFLLRKIVRICKAQNIVSIADFIADRYGKSALLGALVTIFIIIGIAPYIALQLKAVAISFDLLTQPGGAGAAITGQQPVIDTALLVALVLGLFSVLFGARHLDSSERTDGLIAAIALQSLVKIIAMLAVGIFVTYGLFDGFGDIFSRFSAEYPERNYLLTLGTEQIPYGQWLTLTLVGMIGVMFLPRQFHVMVVGNSDESQIKNAMWSFPGYMYLTAIFILPIALGGLLYFQGDVARADYFTILLPLRGGQPLLAVLVFIGGFSAAAGMVMVSSVTISTMLLNHLVMPVILKFDLFHRPDISGILINIKRLGILAVIFLGYFYYQAIGDSYALANMGQISFLAAAQFAPCLLAGLYWRRANRTGALAGLLCGFITWFYTLLIPSFARSGWLNSDILENGLFGFRLLRPLELFGLRGLDTWSHALFWTLLLNIGALVVFSLLSKTANAEIEQAGKFVDIFAAPVELPPRQRLSKAPTIMEFVDLMSKFIGEKQAHAAIAEYLGTREIDARGSLSGFELPQLKQFTERTLAGAVGAAPARIIIENYLAARGSEMEDVFDIFGSVTISRKSSREQLGVLYETAKLVASGADLQTILDDLIKLFRQQFRFDLCVIRILDEEQGLLVVRSQTGMSSEHFGSSHRKLDMDTYPGATFLTNSMIVVNDTSYLDKPISAQVIHREGIKSFAHAPICIEGKPIGVLSTFSKSAKEIFTEEFLELYHNLSDQVGLALRNAQQTQKLISAKAKERELQIARAIQLGLLPTRTPEITGVCLAGVCLPASDVGGDYYDFLTCSEDRLDLVIADVSGHNVGAALIMGWARTFIQAKARDLKSPGKILSALCDFFNADLSRAELFITMFYLQYQPASRQLIFANAGHNQPLLWRAQTGACERLDAEGLILGIETGVVFEEKQLQLAAGDLLLLYTDGLTEAEDARGNFFGEERLCALLEEFHSCAPAEILDKLLEQARGFAGKQTFNDDVTLVVLRA